jgi:hypothetical protein
MKYEQQADGSSAMLTPPKPLIVTLSSHDAPVVVIRAASRAEIRDGLMVIGAPALSSEPWVMDFILHYRIGRVFRAELACGDVGHTFAAAVLESLTMHPDPDDGITGARWTIVIREVVLREAP